MAQHAIMAPGVSGPFEEADKGHYLHRGIATRVLGRRLQLADFIEAGSARSEQGLLSIKLKRVVPEAMKPRKIEIRGGNPANYRNEGPKADNQAV